MAEDKHGDPLYEMGDADVTSNIKQGVQVEEKGGTVEHSVDPDGG